MINFSLKVLTFILHAPAFFLIYYLWKPISEWYLSQVPALGVDLYLSATYVSYHLEGLRLPYNSFKDFWFGGYPLMSDMPQLPFYLMMPFAAIYGAPIGVQMFTMISLFFFIAASYFLFYVISKNHAVSLLLAILVLLSPNIYGSATWAGSIPYFASQIFFPLGLLFGTLYLRHPQLRYLAMVILVAGVGSLIHPLGILAFLVPSLFLVIIVGGFYSRLPVRKIIGHLVIFNIGWLLAAFTVTYDYVLTSIARGAVPKVVLPTTVESAATAGAAEIAQFYSDQIKLIFSGTDEWIFLVLALGFGFFLASFIFSKSKRDAILIIPFILIAIWAYVHPAINLGGVINLLRHDPYRAFWQFPVATGALAAAFWGFGFSTVSNRLSRNSLLGIFNLTFIILISGVFVFLAYAAVQEKRDRTIEIVEKNSELSSAFPEALSIELSPKEQEQLKKQLLPSFIDPKDQNKRLYTADQTVNLWWNTLFEMPLARGYVDPPIGLDVKGGFFWLDIAIANDSLTRDFKVPEEIAFNNALFLIDWYAVNFFEGGRLGSKGSSPGPSTYLLNHSVFDKEEQVTTFGAVLRYQTASGKPELHRELPQYLRFFKVSDRYSSPIVVPTNATPILVFTNYSGYEDLLRILATKNLNSKTVIPVFANKPIDSFRLDELKTFDGVILHQYQYKNKQKAFDLLEKYVAGGGKLFIDTGGEVGESKSDSLPEVFPIKTSVRKGFGKEWDFSITEDSLTREIDFSKFGPPIFAQDEWKLSTSKNEADLRPDSVILAKHKGKPLLVKRELGKGLIVWSGFNLFYHFNQYKVIDEANLFINILGNFANISEKEILSAKTSWVRPEKVKIELPQTPRGVLFKEQGYNGWKVRLQPGGSQSLPIYLAGPTYPGFMYVPLTPIDGPVSVEFTYHGTLKYWLVGIVNLASLLILLDVVILNGRVLGRFLVFIRGIVGKRVSFWWEKEEE